ncbi:ATPase family associated with various cellular activities (AAA) [Nitrosospira multiformis]|uniref:ATPase family associated with various cellular activities (AAA) n=1 Tax=Nitrosospira multiformis TaxID=1231 RepID=A0A1H8LFJ9_9PROT|nr:ATP-binding protein [Nitrosospira multiformis]SEO03576.1 ATPase family associated with various cellular activities (AAA) [Nitrosospira multiformis]
MMSEAAGHDWQSANQHALMAALADLKSMLRRHAALKSHTGDDGSPGTAEPASPVEEKRAEATAFSNSISNKTPVIAEPPAALEALCASFSLSRFERDLLLLCAGIELDSTVAPLCAAAQGDPGRNYPTFSLALAVLPDAHWSALTPEGPLRRWRLIEVGNGSAVTAARLRIDECVLHYLAGVPQLDEWLAGMIEPIAPVAIADLAPSHAAIAEAITAAWSVANEQQPLPAIQLCSRDLADCRPVVSSAAASVGLGTFALPTDLVPVATAELDALLRLCQREAALGNAVLLLEFDSDSNTSGDARSRGAERLIERFSGPIIITSQEPRRIAHRPAVQLNMDRLNIPEQRSAWRLALGAEDGDTIRIDAIASQFSMSLPAIRSIANEVIARAAALPGADLAQITWQACRSRCRTRLDGLAQRIEPAADWEDLVLPQPQIQLLRQIAIHVRRRETVYDKWGFGAKSSRGLGISALFAGVSGTGKTMAAEVLAAELQLDLYRIDLASTVSKYIGETEKNLRKIFDAAEESGAILLFDEADALFGKRSEVKDSHDRYANIEVSYLLQRIEAYRGLAILTTNLKSSVDAAFLRRLRFIVQFPFPGTEQRAEIWRRVFPAATPTEGLDVSKLAKLNIPGGNIRNIALNAMFLAADAEQPVSMSHIHDAAKTEYAKLERPFAEAEIGGWL